MGQTSAAIGAAVVYTGGRVVTNELSWVQSLVSLGVQSAIMLAMLDKQKGMYDDIASKQIGYVETALNQYILDVNNTLIPTFKDAYPDVPTAAPYTPVDTRLVVYNQMVENIANLPVTEDYIIRVNHLHRTNYIARMALLSPGFMQNITLAAYQIRDLLDGRMSTGDVVEILTDTAEQAILTGRIGAGHKTTHRNLGISRMRAQAAGRAAMHENAAFLNRDVSPITLEANFNDQMIQPQNRLALAIQEAQLLQNSLQNIYNTAAQKPPHKLAELQVKLQTLIARLTYSANKGNMANQFVPNYSAVLGPAVQGLIGNMFKTTEVDKSIAATHPSGEHNNSGGVSLF